MLIGHRTVCAVEFDAYARSVLLARQADGTFPPFPVWDDVRTFDGRPWRGIVDVVSGGFPCQDLSVAGKGAGIDGERSGLWREMARIIGEVRPRFAFIENSPALITRGLDRVLCDLAALGYDAEWCVLGASDVGAPHKRERIWILAHSRTGWVEFEDGGFALADTDSISIQGLESEPQQGRHERPAGLFGGAGVLRQWPADPADAPESKLGRVVDGLANRSHRIKAIGNGQVPRVRAAAWRILQEARRKCR
ncbi:MAG: DNA cytosine methyltransferase [Pseudomonadota bacterium]